MSNHIEPWSSLVNLVLIDVKGCLDTIVEEKLRESAIEFCEESEAWREWLDPITVVNGFCEAELDALPETRIIQIMKARHNGKEVKHTSETLLDENKKTYRSDVLSEIAVDWRTEKGKQIEYFYMENPYTMRLVPIPSETQAISLKVNCALAPSISATGLYRIVYEYYYQQIVSGAKALLMEMKGVDWSDPVIAAHHRRIFNSDKFKARQEGARKFQRSDFTALRTRAYW